MKIDTHLLSRRITHFLAVFENDNIHSAAERIGLSQPALSMSIKQLEEELGITLFQRQSRGVIPTDAGQILYRYASSMRQAARLANEEIHSLTEGTTIKLKLGAGVAWTTEVLPEVLADLRIQFPDFSIDMISAISELLAARFIKGDIDVFLAAGAMPDLDTADVKHEFIANIPMSAVVDSNNKLAKQEIVTPADLVTTSWAGFYEDEEFRHVAKRYLSLRGLPAPKVTTRTNSAAALASLVKGSDMVTILMAPLAQSLCQSGLTELRLSEPLWKMPISLYYREMTSELKVVSVFRKKVKAKIRSLV